MKQSSIYIKLFLLSFICLFFQQPQGIAVTVKKLNPNSKAVKKQEIKTKKKKEKFEKKLEKLSAKIDRAIEEAEAKKRGNGLLITGLICAGIGIGLLILGYVNANNADELESFFQGYFAFIIGGIALVVGIVLSILGLIFRSK